MFCTDICSSLLSIIYLLLLKLTEKFFYKHSVLEALDIEDLNY